MKVVFILIAILFWDVYSAQDNSCGPSKGNQYLRGILFDKNLNSNIGNHIWREDSCSYDNAENAIINRGFRLWRRKIRRCLANNNFNTDACSQIRIKIQWKIFGIWDDMKFWPEHLNHVQEVAENMKRSNSKDKNGSRWQKKKKKRRKNTNSNLIMLIK